MSPTERVLARALARPGPDDLFLAGDAGQRISRSLRSWQSWASEVRGHSSRLKVNYRTTQAIRAFADKVQPTAESGAAEREERDAVSFLTGPKTPTATGCPMAVNCFRIYGAERGTWPSGPHAASVTY